METTNLKKFIADSLSDTELGLKLSDMMNYVIGSSALELAEIQKKRTDPEVLSEDTIKAIIQEQGFQYIVDVMDTIDGFMFNKMIYFINLINELKGTRQGLELVLKLLGFDSIIKEWWQNAQFDREPWTYEIIVIVNSSYVPDLYKTLDMVKVFSQNYVIAKVTNIETRFLSDNFAMVSPVMGGFVTTKLRGRILQRANP